MAENQTKVLTFAPTMAFEALCDEMGIDDAIGTYTQVNWTTGTYRKYLDGYRKALQKKTQSFRLTSVNKTQIVLGEPRVKIWKVVPKNILRIKDSNIGWFACPDLSEKMEEGDRINLYKGREGSRELNSDNFRKVKGQYQFRFPELTDGSTITVYGEEYSVEATFTSISNNPDVLIGGRKVKSEKISETSLAVYSTLKGNVTIDGKNVEYQIESRDDIPPRVTMFEEGYLVFSESKPSGSSVDVTGALLAGLSPVDLSLGGKTLAELGFESDGRNRFVSDSCGFIEEKVLISAEYPDVEIPIQVTSAQGFWYSIKMPASYDAELTTDPRMIVFEENAIITSGKTKLSVKRKDTDEMLVEFYEETDKKERKSVDLGKTAEISIRFDTRDIVNQLIALDTLKTLPPREAAPLINMFRKSEGKGNWSRFRTIAEPKYGWRVLEDDSFSGVVEQRNFVRKALSTPDFAILDGPPGTGKTTAIRELIIQLILDGKRVLVASSTNAAIDNVLDRIVNIDCKADKNHDFKELLRPIRLGRAERASDDVRDYSMEVMIQNNILTGLDENLLQRVLIESSNLVCGTITKVYSDLIREASKDKWKNKLSTLPTFDYLIMDESSKTTFQEFIVPAKLAKHWILAGDVRQLSPFTEEGAVETALDLFSGCESELNVTDTTKTAVTLINECKLIIPHSQDRRYSIIVNDMLAREIGAQLQKMDIRITAGMRAVYHEECSYTEVYGGRVLFVGKTLFLKRRQILPLDTYIINLTGDNLNVSPENYHFAWMLDIDDDQERSKKERVIREDIENLKKSWAESIAWRLNRDYWLRNVKQQKSTYIKEITERIPGEFNTEEGKKNFKKKCIWVVQDVVFHSILELLTVKNGNRDNNLVQSFEPEELALRSESLIYQHRMHEDISRTPASVFYGGKLMNGPKVNETGLGYYIRGFEGQHNVWIDCSGKDSKNINVTEIDRIIECLKDFIEWARKHPKSDGSEYTVIVLTFYLAQSNLMKERIEPLKRSAWNIVRIKVATVDYIQGQEADVVYLSMVRNNKVGFMDTPNRLNVAITRAKHLMVFIGNKKFFSECKSIELRLIVEGCNVH